MRRGRRGGVAGDGEGRGGGEQSSSPPSHLSPPGGRGSGQGKEITPLQYRREWKEFLLSAKKRDESTDGRV